jgi:hypothetical protein
VRAFAARCAIDGSPSPARVTMERIQHRALFRQPPGRRKRRMGSHLSSIHPLGGGL